MIDYIILLMFVVSIYYTFKYKCPQRNIFIKSKEVFFVNKTKSAYQSFLVALASHIGVGNIIGVTTALIYGGPGSIFWMVVFAIFTSVFSLMENTLSVKYRVKVNDEYRGGSAYYIYYGLKKNFLGLIVAIFLLITSCVIFQSLQVNALSESIKIVFTLDEKIIYIIIVLFTILFIFSGTKMIIKLSEIIVPIMAISYLVIVLLGIILNIKELPSVISLIFKEAFNFRSIFAGGLYIGIKRSLFSHEAGLGTMPTISAMSDVKKSIDQGYVQMLGVFIDTVFMCSLTGIMILVHGVDLNNYTGYDLIIYTFNKIFGDFGKYIGCFFLGIFALGTIISQYYLGESNLIFITKQKENKIFIFCYQVLFIVGITIGVFFPLNKIWDMIDYGMVVLGVINIIVLIAMEKEFKNEFINGNNFI